MIYDRVGVGPNRGLGTIPVRDAKIACYSSLGMHAM
jgi:hypothetical protein